MNSATEDTSSGSSTLSREELFDVLGNERRRCLLEFFLQHEDQVAFGRLVDQVAAWENDKRIAEITEAERNRVRTALRQSHLPKMEETGLIEFDEGTDTIRPADGFTEFDVYLQVIGGSVPYSVVYLGLAVLGAGLFAGALLEVPPLPLVPDLAWMALTVVAFGITSLLHLRYTRRRELVPDFVSEFEE